MARSFALALMLMAFATACESSHTSSPAPQAAHQNSGNANQAPNNASSKATGTNTGQNSSSGATAPDDPNLPSYLFTAKGAEAITPWAKPLVETRDANSVGPSIAGAEPMRQFIESFLNRVMKLDAVKPGRTLRVTIVEDKDPNAYADGHQNVVINSAYFTGYTGAELLAVLCHEVTHSLRNDPAATEDYMNNILIDDPNRNPKAKQIYDQIDQYVSKQYNQTTRVYTHNAAEYHNLLVQWNAYRKDFWTYSKRVESTADVIGGAICASLGMDPEDFRQEFVHEGQDVGAFQTAESVLKDGSQYDFASTDDLVWKALFIDDDHPSFPERIDQVQRVKPFLSEHLSSDKSLYNEWVTQFKALSSQISGISLSLTNIPATPHTLSVHVTGTDQTVVIRSGEPKPWLKRPVSD